MSSKAGKSSDNVQALAGGASRHKSSDRLHRMGALTGQGGSSTNLGANKRSKSYSQIMSVTDGSGKKKQKKQQQQPTSSKGKGAAKEAEDADADGGDDDDDDGWISSSQAGTPGERSKENSPPGSSDEEDEEEDEGLVMGKSKRKQPSAAAPSQPSQPTETNGADVKAKSKANGAPQQHAEDEGSKPLKRTDTQITLRGFEPVGMTRRDSQRTVAGQDDEQRRQDAGQEDKRQQQVRREEEEEERRREGATAVLPASPAHLRRPTNHWRTDSEETLAQQERGTEEQATENRPEALHLVTSSDPKPDGDAPTLTLTPTAYEPSAVASPASTRSQRPASLRPTRSSSLFPRESHGLAPMLSTHNALTGALGSLYEGRQSESRDAEGSRRSSLAIDGYKIPGSSSEPFDLSQSGTTHGSGQSRRKASVSSTRSNINIGSGSPSMANVSHARANAEQRQAAAHSPAVQAIQRASGSGFPTASSTSSSLSSYQLTPGPGHERRRTQSTQSLTAADAAKLAAKLRMARANASHDDGGPVGSSSSGGSYGRASGLKTSTRDQAMNAAIARYNKPVISKFAKDQAGLENEPVEVVVDHSSIYNDEFTRASTPVSGDEDIDGDAEVDDAPGRGRQNKNRDSHRQHQHRHRHQQIRYVMDFGLGGPALEKSATTDALLSPSLENDEFEASWAPALTQAAGLGARSLRSTRATREGKKSGLVDENGMPISPAALAAADGIAINAEAFANAAAAAAAGSIAVNGPNAMPLHFSHGLTTTSDEPFPLDLSDIAGSRALLEGGDEAAAAQAHLHAQHGEGRFLDSKTLRAIAMTAQALSVYRSHIVTRRFSDPMRESLERVGRASGHLPLHAAPSTPTPGAAGASHRRWGSSSTTSRAARSPLRETSQRRPDFPRSNTMGHSGSGEGGGMGGAAGALASLAEQAEHPLLSLKRVWSGGAALHKAGGLSSLSRSRTTDDR